MIQPTSRIAFDEVKKTLGNRQLVVLEHLGWGDPKTNTELATMLNWPINTVVPRIFELREKGLVKEHCRRKCNITRRMAIAWRCRRIDEIKERQLELDIE